MVFCVICFSLNDICLFFLIDYIGLIEEKTEKVECYDSNNYGDKCLVEVDTQIVDHMYRYSCYEPDYCSYSIGSFFVVKSECAVGNYSACYNVDNSSQ